MAHDIIFLLLGIVLIMAGGNFVTDGAVAVAQKFRISPMVIGLTVVAFGSSTPDLVVTLISVIEDHPQLAIGDIVGANIFDLTIVAGVIAIISPIVLSRQSWSFDLPMLLLSSVILFICGDDKLIDGKGFINTIDRTDGLLMLFFFGFFMYTLLKPVLSNRSKSEQQASAATAVKPKYNMAKASILIIAGLAALVFGGDWLVDGASGIARRIGMSEGLIGLTVVGIGNALPDLATSASAALKKQPGIALGNLVGACIFNVFFIIGLCATVKPMSSGSVNFIDYGTLVLASLLLVVFGSMRSSHTIRRGMGVVLIAVYVAYMTYLVLQMCGVL